MSESHAPASPGDDGLTVRLDQFLQLAGVAGTGGQAKVLIQSGAVLVDGVLETRRRRKLSPGAVVSVGGEEFEIAAPADS
ncbi:RNA-binding S4 domain-containing protein [Alienimonas californiensis]|uniref:Ribosome-associated protein n=1 Tax=Alienimonas californiensis TaxID=2527989 RepID=A0A517P924_9PLAN|nr:RNA-binding S4 domain-containing protein [Alienimonas californiensis]QDT15874.1 ribosome-associated protein [Alienimonas californiensis]